MRKTEPIILGALLAALVIGSALFTRDSIAQRQMDRPTTFSTGPGGLRACLELLQRQRVPAARLHSGYEALGDRTLLVIAMPLAEKPESPEERALTAWIEGGGAALVLWDGSAWPALLEGLTPTSDRKPAEPIAPDAGPLGGLRFAPPAPGRGICARPPWRVLAGGGNAAVAARRRLGKGTVTVLSQALGLRNRDLRNPSDAPVAFVRLARDGLAPGGRVLFDEVHHGFGETRPPGAALWTALGPGPHAFAWALLGLVAALIWNGNRRLGAPLRLEPGKRTSTLDYVTSMAGLYGRAQAAPVAVELLGASFRRRMARRFGVSADAPAAELAVLTPDAVDRPELEKLLCRCDDISAGGDAGESDLMEIARGLDAWARRLRLDD
ncbi:MAG: hypothetical protein NT029_20510 [Armatimonadetes bacterium]|nr:hypothetical protein [Armatimonadota bacterium]